MEQARTDAKQPGGASVFFQTLAGFALAALVVLGVGGTVYKVLAPGGWLAQLFGASMAGGMAAVIALVGIGFFAWFTREWVSVRRKNRYSELFVYTFAAAGILYVIQLLVQGAF